MSHTNFHPDFDPNTQEVETTGHFHALYTWSGEDEQGHDVSLKDAEAELEMRLIDEQEYSLIRRDIWPVMDVQVPVNVDGNYEIRKRQRLNGGPWAGYTPPVRVEINLQPAEQAAAPSVSVLESDDNSTEVEVGFVYPDRDVQGNVIEPAQALVSVLPPGGHPITGWLLMAVGEYGNRPQESVTFRLPHGDGVKSYLVRVRITNICQILNEPSPATAFDIDGTRLKDSGTLDVRKGCA